MIRLAALLTVMATAAFSQSADISVQPLDAPFDFGNDPANPPQEQDTSTFGQTPTTGEPIFNRTPEPILGLGVETSVDTVRVQRASGAVLKALDKVTGDVVEMTLANGHSQRMGRIEILMSECRQPADNPTGDAFAWVEVQSEGRDAPDFSGWMIASSPALSALDHPRYDVWVMRCNNS